MTVVRVSHSPAEQRVGCLVLVDTGPHGGLTLLPRRRREAWLARLCSRWLDAQLAAGQPAESGRLTAVRAAQIVAPRCRRRLARQWAALAGDLHEPRGRGVGRSATDVADEIEQLADVLRADRVVFAQGVAIAATMLRAARSAVARFDSGGDDLAAAIARAAVAAMQGP
jgi:hypothetical protein